MRYDSQSQRCSGTGEVVGITISQHDGERGLDYQIAIDASEEERRRLSFSIQAGILENEIELLTERG